MEERESDLSKQRDPRNWKGKQAPQLIPSIAVEGMRRRRETEAENIPQNVIRKSARHADEE